MIVACTGHRNLPGGYEIPNPTYNFVCQETKRLLLELKPDQALSGFAVGYDQWFANICIQLQIPFKAIIPFNNQDKVWPAHAKKIYQKLLSKAAEKIIVSEGEYAAFKLQIRNEYLVDHSDILIACYEESREGGTKNCIDYAKSKNKQIIIIDPTKAPKE